MFVSLYPKNVEAIAGELLESMTVSQRLNAQKIDLANIL
jgi:hypothetical protein